MEIFLTSTSLLLLDCQVRLSFVSPKCSRQVCMGQVDTAYSTTLGLGCVHCTTSSLKKQFRVQNSPRSVAHCSRLLCSLGSPCDGTHALKVCNVCRLCAAKMLLHPMMPHVYKRRLRDSTSSHTGVCGCRFRNASKLQTPRSLSRPNNSLVAGRMSCPWHKVIRAPGSPCASHMLSPRPPADCMHPLSMQKDTNIPAHMSQGMAAHESCVQALFIGRPLKVL